VRTRPLRYNKQVDKAGQTVSATEFAELTGVSRERLRTWERRFGFPRPDRVQQGPRRYALADAPRVVAVRRASEEGVPLPRAIADASDASGIHDLSQSALASTTAVAPIPVVLVTGPQPLQIAYVNASLQALDGAIPPGARLDALPWFIGSDLERTLHTLFAGIFALTMVQMSLNAPQPQLAIQAVVLDASQINAASKAQKEQEREDCRPAKLRARRRPS